MPGLGKVAVVTGASRGIGYAIGKELALRIPHATVKLTTRGTDNMDGLQSVLRSDIGSASDRCVYRRMEVMDPKSVKKLAGVVKKKHGSINILVNNAAVFSCRPNSLDQKEMASFFHKEAQEILKTNYYGLKCVTDNFLPMMSDNARITNIGSHLGMICCVNGDEPFAGELRENFTDTNITEKDLDHLLERFLESIKKGTWEKEGWPSCSYSVSKVAVNAYTGILQRRLDKEMPERGIVVNSVHTGAPHSKMKQKKESTIPREEGAAAVAYVATLGIPDLACPRSKCLDVFEEKQPRGKILWHDLREIEWTADTVRPMIDNNTLENATV